MIDKREILSHSSAFSLLPNVVEKDYVLGWILGGIANHPQLADSWVFKGGTCLKKCYFETYRFSEDLDFTLRDEKHINQDFLKKTMGEVVDWVADNSGLAMPVEQLSFDIYENLRGKLSCQGKVGYRGPVSPTTGRAWPKIKLDLTADEKLVLPSTRRPVFHPYSDSPEDGHWANCYAYEEAFAEKIRALGERTRPRDLYDVVNLYRHRDGRPPSSVLLDVLKQKCAYKSISVPSVDSLLPHRQELEANWKNMLGHQLPVLPPVGDFWAAIPEIFEWIINGAAPVERGRIDPSGKTRTVFGRVLPMKIPAATRAIIEIIRFAAANYLCVDLEYDNRLRRIEPYSLRETQDGNFLLHAIRAESDQNRAYRLDRIKAAAVTDQAFVPRYLVELTLEGPLPIAPSADRSNSSRATNSGPIYVIQCPICDKTFQRKSMTTALNAHKNQIGNACSGRTGIFDHIK